MEYSDLTFSNLANEFGLTRSILKVEEFQNNPASHPTGLEGRVRKVLVPGAGLEPARVFGSTVFETAASTIPPSRL
jgi:hypothetical protein